MHEHTYQGQTLRHDHEGGTSPHGYYGHPEDAGSPEFGTGTYELLSAPALLDRVTGFMNEQLGQDDMSLAEIAGEVITMVTEDGAPTDEQAAVRDAIIEWQNGDEGARDRLNMIFASWAANSLPIPMQNRQEIADSIAMTITAGISPYLEATVLRLSAKVREVSGS